jgi:hypothetical protein
VPVVPEDVTPQVAGSLGGILHAKSAILREVDMIHDVRNLYVNLDSMFLLPEVVLFLSLGSKVCFCSGSHKACHTNATSFPIINHVLNRHELLL